MYVCICKQITDRQIRELCKSGHSDLSEIRARLGVATECGKCTRHARSIVSEFIQSVSFVNAAAS